MSKRKKNTSLIKKIIYITVIFVLIVFAFLFTNKVLTKSFSFDSDSAQIQKDAEDSILAEDSNILENKEEKDFVKHIATPSSTKAIYMTACVAGTNNFRNELVQIADTTEINSIIIDIKDFTGTISFDTGADLVGESGTGCRSSDLKDFIKILHDKGIYVMGRVTVFQDPLYSELHPELAVKKESDRSVWKDYKGLSFIDVGAKDYWDYIVDLAKLSHQAGFDEINLDYIRFPSDGNMKDIYFEHSVYVLQNNPGLGKQIALENFFKYFKEKIDDYNSSLEEGVQPLVTSADLFGMVTTNHDDLNIGQVLERALPYFNYIAPMVYPSHYPQGFNGWADPNKVVYDLINFVMSSAYERVEVMKNSSSTPESVRNFISTDQLRPWLQDFNYGGYYGPKEVRDQIQATYDSKLDSWMIWSPSNKYTIDALLKE